MIFKLCKKLNRITRIILFILVGGLLLHLDRLVSMDLFPQDDNTIQESDNMIKETSFGQLVDYGKSGNLSHLQLSDEGLRRIHVVMTFPLYKLDQNDGGKSNEERVTRMKEYILSLREMLLNENVNHVYLLHDDDDMEEFIKRNVGIQPRLSLHQKESVNVVRTLHQFAFEHLQNKLVCITNADIILGTGFDQIDASYLRERKLLYALSRSVVQNDSCKAGYEQCYNYVGSHDSFVFVPQGKIDFISSNLLSHHFFEWGTENVIMYVYTHRIGYKVTNPCKVIRTFHVHCGAYRESQNRKRVNHWGISLSIPPTDTLKG